MTGFAGEEEEDREMLRYATAISDLVICPCDDGDDADDDFGDDGMMNVTRKGPRLGVDDADEYDDADCPVI